MSKQDELNKKLFNRLFLKMPTIRKLKLPIKQVGKIKLDKSIKYIYYSKENKMWFTHSENKSKFFYFIGLHDDHINRLNSVSNSFVLDFDKNNNINNHSLGLINDLDMSVYINKNLLEKKYPDNDFNNFKEHILNNFERSRKTEITTFELGKIYGTFYENLKKLIDELPLNTKKHIYTPNDENNSLQEMNLFLNAITAEKTYEEALQIARINSSKVKYWYINGKKGKEDYTEFYETYKEFMLRNNENYQKMKIIIDSLKSGKTEEESLALSGASSQNIQQWIKKGKNGDIEFIDFYEEYNQLIKKSRNNSKLTNKTETKKNKKSENKVKTKNKQKNNELIESYINLINEGKTNKEAIEILNIPPFKIKNWRQQGKLGNKDFTEFYNAYQKAISIEKSKKVITSKKEDKKLINEYIKLIDEGKTNKEAFKTLNIPRFKTKNWKQQGQLGNEDYKEFYETYLKAVKTDEINKANKFIELINEGKSNEEAIQIIRIPDFKIKQWFNNGKNGDKNFVEFYKAYMKQYDNKIENKNHIPDHNLKPPVKEIETKTKRSCEICGRSMSETDSNKLCKRCRRKQRCANIIQQLLQSIEPEIPFRKEDLKRLNLNNIQIQDYIWTLQEFDIINKEKNNKLSLVKKEILDKFIEESGVEIIDEQISCVKLTKKCDLCGEILEISKFSVSENSPDGYENTCKSCKKLITTATFLKEILEYINFNQEFSEDELTNYINDPFLRQAKVWSLLENDLLIKDNETNKFKLANEELCYEFIEKYYRENTKKPTSEPIKTKPPIIETPITKPPIIDKQKQMEIVMQARQEGKTRKESAKLAGISLYKITHWYKEGRDGFGEDNVYFYKKLKEIETTLLKKLKKQMNTFLNVLKKGGSVSEAIDKASISQEDLDNWIKKGKNNIKPYKSFLKEYSKYVKKSTEYNNEYNIKARKKFLKNIYDGKTRKESAKKAEIDIKLLDSWIIKGTKGQKPYTEFYKDYKKARENAKSEPNSKEEKIKKEFIDLMNQGHTLGEAANMIENGAYAVEIKKWYIAGKQGVSKHLKFYVKCQEARNKFKINKNRIFIFISDGFTIKESCEKLKLNPIKIKKELLEGKKGKKPQDKFYNKLIESKTSLIDIKKLFKYPDHPHKDQMIDVLDLLLIGENEKKALEVTNIEEVTFKYWINRGKQNFGEMYKEFYEIYTKIKSGELIKKFKMDIEKEIQKELDDIINENTNILTMLPKQTRKELNNLIKDDFTGFAWVIKIDDQWIYSKRIDGKLIEITDNDIYNLHRKVIINNYTWGVRDLEKAKQTLKINNDNKNIKPSILSPLPENIKTKFSKGTSTGFAWVSKSGNYFYYIKSKQKIRIKASSIEELYQEVIKNGLDWGVLDMTKAKKTLNENTIQKDLEKPKLNSNDILAPLPEKTEKKLQRYSKGSKTGFAWVGKSGKNYTYERVINGEFISIKEPNIKDLHEKVISKNLTWGVRDIEKAKITLSEKPKEEITPKKHDESQFISDNILAPLPEEIENELKKYSKGSSTGFAWVNKNGKHFSYKRVKNGEQIEFKNLNIVELHKEVIENGHLWGVRDLTKAKQTLPPKFLKKNPEPINNNILKPIPIEIEQKLRKNSKQNKSGFAWVSKVGEKWQYTRIINGTPIHLKDSDIYKLHEIVIKNNYLWGVRDLTKAKQTLKNCDKNLPEPPKIDKIPKKTVQKSFDSFKKDVDSTDILAPLAPEYEISFKSSPGNKTGIAWVNKIGNNWIYSRQIDGETITLKDTDIYQLHKKVLDKNLPWGVREPEKARKIIFNAQPISSTTENISQKEQTVFVTINGDMVSIDGKIRNNEVLKVLTRIYEFGDNIIKINTEKNDAETTLSIELKLNENQKIDFNDKIKNFGWKINE